MPFITGYVVATSNADVGLDPPDLASGTWRTENGFTLTKLTRSGTVSSGPALNVDATVDRHVSCNGGSDGGLTATASGGTSPYLYIWSTGAITPSITGLAAGTYTVTVTDASASTATASATITEPPVLTASAAVDANVSCNSGTDGALTASGTGGTTPYTYQWSNGATTASMVGLQAGTYTATITDANGCTATASATVTEPAVLTASAVVDANVSCNSGTDGALTASGTGGTTPYTYQWSNGATTASMVGLQVGTYTATITDANGCTSTASATITQPTVLKATAVVDANVSCNGGSNGALTASGTGGTTPYIYQWSNGAITATTTGLPAGTYNATITDANGCTSTASATITQPTVLKATAVVDANVSCNSGTDGALTASGTGGTTPYTYQWSNGATTASMVGLQAGTYTATITDANGCTSMASATITQPTVLKATAAVDANVSCNGGVNGAATVSGTGGTTPYTYQWSNGAITATTTGLPAGTYNATITDANGCTSMASATINQPTVLKATAIVDANVSCNGGTDGALTASGTGGTTPYTYQWSNGATTASMVNLQAGTYTVTITDGNGCSATASATVTEPKVLETKVSVDVNVSCAGGANGKAMVSTVSGGTAPYTYLWSNGATTSTVTGLSAGTYTVTTTDANGCTATSEAKITEPAPLSTATTVTNVSCNGGSDGTVDLSVSGGVAPYTFNWSNTATTEDMVGLSAGTYEVTVTDAKGCTTTASAIITEPTVLTATAVVDANVSCHGAGDAAVSASATGGVAPYQYAWSTGAITAAIENLGHGTYTVTITDANGCTASASATVTRPAELKATAVVDANASCNGGSDGALTASGTGGTTPYAYQWSNGATTASMVNLQAGTYTVTITDGNGCTATASATITEPALLSATATVDAHVSCHGAGDGAVSASATGGVAPYEYAWSTGATTAAIENLGFGTYTVTITDANGCTATASATVTRPAELKAAAVVDANVSCNGETDGATSVSVTGGTTPYTYLWSDGATTAAMTGLPAGTYTVTITDANDCTATASVEVTEPAPLTLSLSATTDLGAQEGTATVTAAGGTAPYTYLWNDENAQSTATATALRAATYDVQVTDANGCTVSESVVVDLLGEACERAIAIDSLLGAGLDAFTYSRSFDRTEYVNHTTAGENLASCFGDNDVLYQPVWFTFTGDGNIYHIRTTNCADDAAAADTRGALFEGSCSQESPLLCRDDESEEAANFLIEIQTEEGKSYSLMVDAATADGAPFCLEVQQVATTSVGSAPVRTIAVYPNPTTGQVTFDGIAPREVTVLDAFGRIVEKQQRPGHQLDLSRLPSGVYHLLITDDQRQVFSSRVIRQ
ncbi:hypothetical protein GGR26_002763 [Lewinella marina]|nr:T9SS type A sorting domain-containing protein [Neolewinella marina]NJB86986.1 hypothetical protein [Neolewinella marina]